MLNSENFLSDILFSFVDANIWHAIMHVIKIKKTLIFAIYDLWFPEFVMLNESDFKLR